MTCAWWSPHRWHHMDPTDDQLRRLAAALGASLARAATFAAHHDHDTADRACVRCWRVEHRFERFLGAIEQTRKGASPDA